MKNGKEGNSIRKEQEWELMRGKNEVRRRGGKYFLRFFNPKDEES